MDVRFINPFITATRHVFKTMMKVDTLISKPFIKDGDSRDTEVSALIGLSGDAVGSVVLCFPLTTAVKIASAFAGEPMPADHPDFGDALGEMVNMVAGQAKAQFEGLSCNISLPKVLSGTDMKVHRSRREVTLVLPCDSNLGKFRVEVTMKSKAQAARDDEAARDNEAAAA